MDGGGLSCHRTLSHLSGDRVAPWRSARLVLPDHEGAVRGERRNLSRVQRGRGLARSVAPVRHGLHPVSGTGEAPADAPVPGRAAARDLSQAAGGISANTGDSNPVENAPSAGGSFRCAERLWSTRASGRRPRRILRAHRHLGRLRLSQAGPPTVSGGLDRIASRPGRGDFRGKRPLPRRLRSAAGWDEDDLVLPSRQPWRISRNRAGLYSLSIRRPPPRDRVFRRPIARSKRIDASTEFHEGLVPLDFLVRSAYTPSSETWLGGSSNMRFMRLGLLLALPLAASTIRIIQTNSAGDSVHIIGPVTDKVVGEITGIEVNHGAAAAPDGSRY